MKIGIPQGLLYYKYHPFFETFFSELQADYIVSDNTNKSIMEAGTRNCTSEACLPIKIYHGHVETLKNQCEFLIIPRIMKVESNEFFCPHLCSLPDMILNSIKDMPAVTMEPLYFNSQKKLFNWSMNIGHAINKRTSLIKKAFNKAIDYQKSYINAINQTQYKIKVLLLGHSYLILDSFINMNIIKKLNQLNIGVITSDCVPDELINIETYNLRKKPFWYDYKQSYGSALYLSNNQLIKGIIYLSSFGCGIDAMITEVISQDLEEIPFMVIKLDEHTADAGVDTRIEAFSDMLYRRSS